MSYIIVGFLFWVVIVMLCREIVCWYTKRNETLAVLRGIEAQLKVLSEK